MKAIAVCSGGLDSTVMLYSMIRSGIEPVVLSFDYGQRHKIELAYAEVTAKNLGLEFILTTFPHIGGDALSGAKEVPKTSYDDDSQRVMVSPNRNMIMLAIAGGYAVREGCSEVWYAAHGGDHAIYPDCRPPFVKSIDQTLQEATYEHVRIIAPFIKLTKAQIVTLGNEHSVPFSDTWSCYDPVRRTDGGSMWYVHCGQCGTCRERIEAFELSGIADPTSYHEKFSSLLSKDTTTTTTITNPQPSSEGGNN